MSDKAKLFVDKYKGFAISVSKETGLNYLVILAQAALESGWGEKVVGNNFFGIKWHGKGDKQLITTTEVLSSPNIKNFPEVISIIKRSDGKYTYKVKDWFRRYDSPEQSFLDHAKFFQDNPRYHEAWKVRFDADTFASEIAKAGYATAPDYASQLKAVIKSVERRL